MTEEKIIVKDQNPVYTQSTNAYRRAGDNISWGAILAGVVTFIGLLIVFSMLSMALGLGFVNPTAADPFAGMASSQAILWVVALVVSFLLAGFVAGLSARRLGSIHGFLTWAASLIGVLALTTWAGTSLFGVATDVVGSVAEGTGSAISTAVEGTGSAISDAVSAFADQVDFDNVETDKLQASMKDILEDTDIEELQPEYLQNALNDSVEEVKAAAKSILMDSDEANVESTLRDLSDSLQNRAEDIVGAVDEDALTNAVEKNSDLSKKEAEKAVESIQESYEKAAVEAKNQIDKLTEEVNRLADELPEKVEDAKETAQEVTDTASKGTYYTVAATVAGALLALVGGSLGTKAAEREDR
ncbi:hypothetical protein [Facklamia hominis]